MPQFGIFNVISCEEGEFTSAMVGYHEANRTDRIAKDTFGKCKVF
jgi:hypothetical protein